MVAATPIQTSVNAGEISNRLSGRPDLAAYQAGVAEMLNMIPLVQGPACKRSGTRFVDKAKDQAVRSRLLPFVARTTQAYVIEASDLAFRFYANHAPLGVELATPYPAASLASIDYVQSNDVMYLVDGARAPQRLARTSGSSFAIGALALTAGPFKDLNTVETTTVQASAQTGSVTLTASAATFLPGHAGGLFYLEIEDFRSVAAWEAGIGPIAIGNLRRSEGKVYSAVALPAGTKARTGSVAPTHVRGIERDGMGTGMDVNDKDAGGVSWQFEYGKYGIVRIDTVSSPTVATGTVLLKLPAQVVERPSWRWALGAFSDAEGWPTRAAIWNERLVFAKDNTLYGSVVGDFANFAARNDSGEATADQAFNYRLAGADPIAWIVADRQLLVGTAAAEYAIGPLNNQQVVGSGNVAAPTQSFYGSKTVKPVQMATRTLFVQRAARKLREMGYDFQADRYTAPDLTVRADHISLSGLVEVTAQREPESLVWAARGDGVLVSLTFSTEQEVRGWSRHVLGGGGRVESLCCIPDPAGERDELWVAVARDLAGNTLRSVERLETFWADGDDQAHGYFVDCGLSYDGPPSATFGGLDHLAGSEVALLVDGATHSRVTVAGDGTVTLVEGRTGSVVHIGLPFTARLTSMRIDAAGAGGSVAGKLKRIVAVVTRLLDTAVARFGVPGGRLDQMFPRAPATPMDSPPPLVSGDVRMSSPGGWERDGKLVWESSEPLPMTIAAWMPQVEVSGT